MSTAVYTGLLAVLGRGSAPLSTWSAKLTVRPEIEAFGPNGVVSSKPRPVSVDDSSGEFEVTLFPSTELTGVDGRVGVRYVLELALFDTGIDGQTTFVRHDIWVFTAIKGGGPVKDMGSAPPAALYAGPPWPTDARPGAYFDTETGDIGFYGIGVV